MLSPRVILVATDFTPLAEIGHEAAYALVRAFGAQRLHFEHVVQTGGNAAAAMGSPFADGQIEMILRTALEDGQRRLESIDVPLKDVQVTRHARLGGLGWELGRAAVEQKADLAVVASHGYGKFKRAFLGSAASGLVRSAPCPVLVVGEQRKLKLPLARVLVAVDLSKVSAKVLAHAFKFASPGAEVQVLSMYDLPLVPPADGDVFPQFLSSEYVDQFRDSHEQRLRELVESIPHPGLNVKLEILIRSPASQAILEVAAASPPDLLVLGTSGHSAWHRFVIGSTATRVLNEAKVPVLVVPPDPS